MRLTNRFSIMGKKYDLDCRLIKDAIDKLGQLEDIEEEFGIGLFTLFKALTEGIYVRNEEMAMI